MILRLSDFINEQVNSESDAPQVTPPSSSKKNLRINWSEPDLSKEIDHYDDKAKLEFYQHNITIGNKDIGKSPARSTKFYKYISVNSIQNFMVYEYDNIVNGAYGRAYGDVLIKTTEELKKSGSISLPAPIVIKFINFGETRTSEEASYYLFSGNRVANLALQYNIPIKAWVVDLIPSRRDVRQFADQSGASSDPTKFKKLLRRETGKENIDDLNARERFKIIQSLKNF